MAPTPVKLERMIPFLYTYDNQKDATTLINGFSHGFSLGYEGPRVAMSAKNLKSAYEHPVVVNEKIEKEVQLGRIVGPFWDRPPPLSLNFAAPL